MARLPGLRKLVRVVSVAVGLYFAVAAPLVFAGLRDRAGTADIIVVPANTVLADGSLSERLKSRLDAALGMFNEKRAPIIFVSGGVGREGHDEAAAMAAYLVANGVPPSAIVRDALGVDTAATAANAAKYLRANGLRSALIATQYFHVARTWLALERSGVQVVGAAHADYFGVRDVYSLAREVPAYVFYYATL